VQGTIPPLRRKYNVRVLIPCYKESLAIVQRTVLAARRADKPAGTRVIIYICDDGADPAKSEWVSSLMDRDVIYITGRDKSQKSKNGKSANLNNTLQLIYPDIRDPVNQVRLLTRGFLHWLQFSAYRQEHTGTSHHPTCDCRLPRDAPTVLLPGFLMAKCGAGRAHEDPRERAGVSNQYMRYSGLNGNI
jgi:hypothetical protein